MPACLAVGLPGPPAITLMVENVRISRPGPGLPVWGTRCAVADPLRRTSAAPARAGLHPSSKGCAPATFDDNAACAEASLDEPPIQRPAPKSRPATAC